MKKYLHLSILFAALLMAGLIAYRPALAQDKTLVWNRYDTSITVQQNGDMLLEEVQEIQFTSGTFRFGYAAIPLDRVENISNVRVAEIMPDGSVRDYQPNSTSEYGFTTAIVDGNLEITWYFPATANSSHTYVLRYTVEGGLRIYPEGDQVWWKAIPADHNFPIRGSTITVMPPQTFPKNELVVDAYGHPIDGANYTDRGAVVFTASDIPAGEEIEVRVQFPHGVVQAQPPAWQTADDLRREWGPVVGLLFGALGLATFFGSPVAVYALWYTRGRDVDPGPVPEYISEPPSGLPAGIVGTLIDEQADLKDIIASIFDLAQRGALRMEEKQKTGSLGMSRDFVLHLQDASLAKYPHEQQLIENIFGTGRTERKMSDLREKFYSAIPGLKVELYKAVVAEGFFPTSPEATRSKWIGLSLVGIVLSVGLACCGLIFLGDFSAAALCPGLGLAAGMFALAIVAGHMPRKTQTGAEEAAKWLAFKKYLENIEKQGDLETVKDKFQEFLPYAVAFGLEKRLIRQFSAVNAPAPSWWGPVILLPHHGPVYGRGGRGTASSAPTGGPPGSLAGDAGGIPNLSDMSAGLGQSLSSMSEGLGALLNSAGSTLTSKPAPPPSVSSGGGGWSGGGFSGGGGFGGGGGGGGSRGFG
ncbi:MAG: DUF2207 domain-containing protein [Anaerolineae bacterium]